MPFTISHNRVYTIHSVFENYICIDDYCYHADKLSSFFSRDANTSLKDVKEYFASAYHPSSFIGPLLIALINQIIHNIPISYMLISALATIGSILILRQILKSLLMEEYLLNSMLLLFIFHNHVLLSFINLYQDPIVMLFTCLVMYQTIRILKYNGTKELIFLILILTLGLFTKLSFLPVLIVPGIALLAYKYHGKMLSGTAFKSGFLLMGIPLAVFGSFYWLIPGFEKLFYEHKGTIIWLNLLSFKDVFIEIAALFQIFVILWLFNKNLFKEPVYLVSFITSCVYFISVAAHFLPTAFRLYLPMVPAIIILSVPGIKLVHQKNEKFGFILIWGIIISNIGIAVYSIIS